MRAVRLSFRVWSRNASARGGTARADVVTRRRARSAAAVRECRSTCSPCGAQVARRDDASAAGDPRTGARSIVALVVLFRADRSARSTAPADRRAACTTPAMRPARRASSRNRGLPTDNRCTHSTPRANSNSSRTRARSICNRVLLGFRDNERQPWSRSAPTRPARPGEAAWCSSRVMVRVFGALPDSGEPAENRQPSNLALRHPGARVVTTHARSRCSCRDATLARCKDLVAELEGASTCSLEIGRRAWLVPAVS